LRVQLAKYEQKYQNLDVGKLHEQAQAASSRQEIAETRMKLLERDLFEVRSRIVDIVNEAERKHIGRKQQRRKFNDAGEWKPGEDVEKLCSIFTNFLTSPENFG
jgi:polynucleotide 5'-kinase involved in rRNA processing